MSVNEGKKPEDKVENEDEISEEDLDEVTGGAHSSATAIHRSTRLRIGRTSPVNSSGVMMEKANDPEQPA